jgi:nucleotide-binding universal stress UspA family protein
VTDNQHSEVSTTTLARPVLSRVICGIDGSPEGETAARVTAALAPEGGHVFLMHVVASALIDNVVSAIPGTPGSPADRRPPAQAELDRVRASMPAGLQVNQIVSIGPSAPMLLAQSERLFAEAIAVGSHGHGRAAGVLLGSVATRLVHGARCSVLIARAPAGEPFPRSVAVGFDMSEPGLAALETARELADRSGVPLRILHAVERSQRMPHGETDIDDEIEHIHGFRSPDLLVVGSRGLRGVRALGSVGEAVAHHSPGSVLIVR